MFGSAAVLYRCRVVSYYSCRFYKSRTNKLLEILADMPKANSGRIADAQRQRKTIITKGEKYSTSTVYLQALGTGAKGAPSALYVFTDQKRYLFNCGEGTQRMAHEHKVKLSRLDHIFVTAKTWRNIGGLPGLSLTLQDVGVPNITLHGPEGLAEIYNATKRFVIMKDMNITMATCNEDFEDSVMRVKYVKLKPPVVLVPHARLKASRHKPKLAVIPEKFTEFIADDTDYYGRDKSKMQQDIKYERVKSEAEKKTSHSVAYICTLHKRLGTLDLSKCVERGVKPGPQLGMLKNGQDVVLPNGAMVRAKDVKTPDDPGPVFIVLEVPDVTYLNASEFSSHFARVGNPPENVPSVMVHFTARAVFNHPEYKIFIEKFGTKTTHLLINDQNECLGSEAVHRTQHKLNLLDVGIFPLLKDSSIPSVWENVHVPPLPPDASEASMERAKQVEEVKTKLALVQFQKMLLAGEKCESSEEVENDMIVSVRTLTAFRLRPKKELDRSMEPKLLVRDYLKEALEIEGFCQNLEELRTDLDAKRKEFIQREYPKVVFLGTGSCIPSKTRNTSAIVVHISENKSILMDCGEGTFGQMMRFYGPKRIDSFLRSLKAIYVSHLHADHHIGLIGVLQARQRAFLDNSQPLEPVCLLAPGQIVAWLSYYDTRFERLMSQIELIPNQSLLKNLEVRENISAALNCMGLRAVDTCYVAHCPNAFGVAITLPDGIKITYSGDTVPCDSLIQLGKNSSLLIHEATMEDDLETEARIKMHSTTTQAINIGRAMKAKFTILTHFSQRYARLPRLNDSLYMDNTEVGIAFDNMQIRLSDLPLLPLMMQPLRLMFAEHCDEMDEKADRRDLKRRGNPSVHDLFVWEVKSHIYDLENVELTLCKSSTSQFTKFMLPEKCVDVHRTELLPNQFGNNAVPATRKDDSSVERPPTITTSYVKFPAPNTKSKTRSTPAPPPPLPEAELLCIPQKVNKQINNRRPNSEFTPTMEPVIKLSNGINDSNGINYWNSMDLVPKLKSKPVIDEKCIQTKCESTKRCPLPPNISNPNCKLKSKAINEKFMQTKYESEKRCPLPPNISNPSTMKTQLLKILQPKTSKPKPIVEEDRRKNLVAIRRKYASKDFQINSRFEKIEGLNWISWNE